MTGCGGHSPFKGQLVCLYRLIGYNCCIFLSKNNHHAICGATICACGDADLVLYIFIVANVATQSLVSDIF